MKVEKEDDVADRVYIAHRNTANFTQYVNLTTQERYFKASAFEYVNMFNVYQEK